MCSSGAPRHHSRGTTAGFQCAGGATVWHAAKMGRGAISLISTWKPLPQLKHGPIESWVNGSSP